MPLATTLRLLARARGLTAAEIAQAIPRVGAATVSAWLRGEKMPAQGQLADLARAFGVPAAALLAEIASQFDPVRSKGEHTLLDAYRLLPAKQQAALLDVAVAMSAGATRSTKRKGTSK